MKQEKILYKEKRLKLAEIARREGALGGKILGAGGGGFLLLLVPFEAKHRIACALGEKGGEIVSFAFEGRGLQTWTTHE